MALVLEEAVWQSTLSPLRSLCSRVEGVTASLNASVLLTVASAHGGNIIKEQHMHQKTLTQSDLRQFTGSEQWYRHSFVRKVLYTDGAQYVAETGGAYWLIDEIAFGQNEPSVAAEEFQVWRLKVNTDKTATLSCDDGNDRVVYSKPIEYTDFPLDEIAFYFIDNVIMLTSEY